MWTASLTGCRAGMRLKASWTLPTKFSQPCNFHGQFASRSLHTRTATITRAISLRASGIAHKTRTGRIDYFIKSFPKPHPLFQQHQRFFTSNNTLETPPEPLPTLSPPSVGRWLLISSLLVYSVIVVGGMTRLTESGLSITEWRPITGVLPPLTQEEWEEEFTKYKATPEFKL